MMITFFGMLSSFHYSRPVLCNYGSETHSERMPSLEAEVDEDGDFIVVRKDQQTTNRKKGYVVIEHSMATPLQHVGLQVWRGALLLADYVMAKPDMFAGRVAIELGAGTGLVSIVLAMVAKMVFCTDTGEEVLRLCQRNIVRNSQLVPQENRVAVKELNWQEEVASKAAESAEVGPFFWSREEIAQLYRADVILAADVVYDDDLTDAFFKTAYDLMSCLPSKTVLISVEKRLNFTLSNLEVGSPAYQHFQTCLEELSHYATDTVSFSVDQVPTDFPQIFSYDRVKFLELWKVTSHHRAEGACK
ncbi:PREDICTED: methyltransferase-like protein 22 isoform X2 [Priapulus caudatus]|uniref:Methyltransferase-like protein 22 isoform X2 n=1 Tax=Priapulus caudatus TaxID=37621 RepID=A0ABM1F4Q5_PRICU|nr:PREDICTED: methyltransferase-like protein 22 isoform X2 [Priapulus caudatus]